MIHGQNHGNGLEDRQVQHKAHVAGGCEPILEEAKDSMELRNPGKADETEDPKILIEQLFDENKIQHHKADVEQKPPDQVLLHFPEADWKAPLQ